MNTASLPFIAGNWKMNGLKASATELLTALGKDLPSQPRNCDIAIFPPATLLTHVHSICKQYAFGLGAQDCHFEEKGAFTGDISPIMLKDAGCQYVLLGHSERRTFHEETSIIVRKKTAAAHNAGLTTVVCIGETLEQKENGQTLTILKEQLVESLPENATSVNTIIAYEPVWAIGTGKTPTPEEISVNHNFIHNTLINQFEKPFRILYGGSVKSANTKEILGLKHVGGLLVGGASLNKDEFLGIIEASMKLTISC